MTCRNIPCVVDPNTWILNPCSAGTPGSIFAQIVYQETPVGGKTGTLSFGGMPRAFLTFDDSGRCLLSYTLTSQDIITTASVENIVRTLQ